MEKLEFVKLLCKYCEIDRPVGWVSMVFSVHFCQCLHIFVQNKSTSLMKAVEKKGRNDIVDVLLRYGADVNKQNTVAPAWTGYLSLLMIFCSLE